LILFLILVFLLAPAAAQTAPSGSSQMLQIKKLYDARRWDAVVRAVPETPNQPAEMELYRGLALAQLQRFHEARQSFRTGLQNNPRDVRFLNELAGIDYREKRFPAAKTELRRTLAIDPRNTYANNFLASIYFLEGNLEAALKYWNRDGKPQLSDLTYHVQPGLDRLLLDRAFQFSPGSEWRRDQFLSTRMWLENLDLFSQMRFNLEAQPDGAFNLEFYGNEQSGWRGASLASTASLLRGLPYQSVYPEFYDLNGKGLNWLSFVRWDDEKRRLTSTISAPLFENPKLHFRAYFDGRNENWDLTRTLAPASPSPASMNMERAAVGVEFQSLPDWRWQWNLGAEYSYRKFRSLMGIPTASAPFFTNSSGVALRLGVRHPLIRFPERRFTLDSSASAELAKFYTSPLGRSGRIKGSLAAHWFPQARGDDYEAQTKLRAGGTFGHVPFDDLFMLGFDRDNNLWMRGHNGLVDGKKGNAPLGRDFILSNSEIDKIIYKNAFFTIKLGPFLDTGDIYDSSRYFGSPQWLTDTGVQSKVRLLGSFEFVLGYGRDLRSGNNTFFTTVSR
jgi:hypothetical protein